MENKLLHPIKSKKSFYYVENFSSEYRVRGTTRFSYLQHYPQGDVANTIVKEALWWWYRVMMLGVIVTLLTIVTSCSSQFEGGVDTVSAVEESGSSRVYNGTTIEYTTLEFIATIDGDSAVNDTYDRQIVSSIIMDAYKSKLDSTVLAFKQILYLTLIPFTAELTLHDPAGSVVIEWGMGISKKGVVDEVSILLPAESSTIPFINALEILLKEMKFPGLLRGGWCRFNLTIREVSSPKNVQDGMIISPNPSTN